MSEARNPGWGVREGRNPPARLTPHTAQHDGPTGWCAQQTLAQVCQGHLGIVNRGAGHEAVPGRQDMAFLIVWFASVINERVFQMELVELKQSLNQNMKRHLGAGLEPASLYVHVETGSASLLRSLGQIITYKSQSSNRAISPRMRTVPGEEGERPSV